MLNRLETFDERVFLWLNSRHNAFFDPIMYCASDELFWIPLYLLLFFFLLHRYRRFTWYLLACIVAMVGVSDQLSSHLIKNLVRRLRPSHAPALAGRIHLSLAGPGGDYGFVSSHATNSFALALFLTLVLPREYRPLKILLFCWALLVGYSRVYNGVHYPGDVLCGALLGCLLACIFAWLFKRLVGVWLLSRQD